MRLGDRDPGFAVVIDTAPLPQLPAAVEAAAYRIAVEALTNVARHAHARTCTLSLRVQDRPRAHPSSRYVRGMSVNQCGS